MICKKKVDEILPILKEGRWLTAQEALEYGFIDEIIDIVCKNVIKRMNAEMRKVSLCADFPKEFTFFDQLSVLHQSKDYDEIFFFLFLGNEKTSCPGRQEIFYRTVSS